MRQTKGRKPHIERAAADAAAGKPTKTTIYFTPEHYEYLAIFAPLHNTNISSYINELVTADMIAHKKEYAAIKRMQKSAFKATASADTDDSAQDSDR